MRKIIQDIFSDKKILILGFGREGRESLSLISKYIPNSNITIADRSDISIPNNISQQFNCITGVDYAKDIDQYDIIVKSPGIPEYIIADVDKHKITSQTDLFLRRFHHQVIGVTGTKGKSTTSSLIAHILTTAKIDNVLVGNIGIAPFSAIDSINDDTIIVMELSAHQLKHIHIAPHISIFLNIHEEHLDHFITFDNYFSSKCNIFLKQSETDLLFIDKNDIEIVLKAQSPNVKSKVRFVDIDLANNIQTNLCGKHNQTNASFAIEVANLLQISDKDIIKSLNSFTPLHHRLENLGRYNGIEFINDSISTIPEAAIAALTSTDNVGTIILGGYDRGISYKKLAKHLSKQKNLNVIVTGKAGERISQLIDEILQKQQDSCQETDTKAKENNANVKVYHAKDMAEIIDIAYKVTPTGSKCILSPAASSYDQYNNFEERGKHYEELIKAYKKAKI